MAAAVVIAATAVASFASAPVAPFMVGVLRRDGVILPFAEFDGKHWTVPWPAAGLDDVDIPINLEAISRRWWGRLGPRLAWRLFENGRPAGSVRVTAPAVVAGMCAPQIGLLTDYRARDPLPFGAPRPYPKDALAVSPDAPIESIRTLTDRDPEWTSIGPLLKKEFDRQEDELASVWTLQRDPHPIGEDERHAGAISVEAMYGYDDGSRQTYYVEASRTYDHSNDERAICAVAFGGAFFERDSGGRFRSDGVDLRVEPCDRRGIGYMLPFGVVRARSHTYWIAQLSGRDSELYEVIDFKRPKAEVAAWASAGRCAARPTAEGARRIP